MALSSLIIWYNVSFPLSSLNPPEINTFVNAAPENGWGIELTLTILLAKLADNKKCFFFSSKIGPEIFISFLSYDMIQMKIQPYPDLLYILSPSPHPRARPRDNSSTIRGLGLGK